MKPICQLADVDMLHSELLYREVCAVYESVGRSHRTNTTETAQIGVPIKHTACFTAQFKGRMQLTLIGLTCSGSGLFHGFT